MGHQDARQYRLPDVLLTAVFLLIGCQSFAETLHLRVAFERVPGSDEIDAGNVLVGIKVLEQEIAQSDQINNGDILATLCGAYILNKSLKKAESACNQAVSVDPSNTAFNNRGVLRAMTGDLSGAREDFDRARPPKLDVYLDELRKTNVPLVAHANFEFTDRLLTEQVRSKNGSAFSASGAKPENLIE